jgi:hypothetical protein
MNKDMRYCGNDSNTTRISDALVEMGETTYPVDRKLSPKAKPVGNFSGGRWRRGRSARGRCIFRST